VVATGSNRIAQGIHLLNKIENSLLRVVERLVNDQVATAPCSDELQTPTEHVQI